MIVNINEISIIVIIINSINNNYDDITDDSNYTIEVLNENILEQALQCLKMLRVI